MINENMKSIHTDSTGAVTVTEVGKKYNRMMSLRRPKYGCMADLSSLPTDSRGRIQWSKSIGKKIYVTYEEIYASFTVTGISRVAGCHDAYVRVGKNGHICSLKRSWPCKKVDDAVAEIIINLVNNPEFSKVMKTKIKTKVDTAEAEKELEVAKKSLKQYQALKDRLMLQIDSLDPFDKNFDRKYDDMQNRLEGMYERISDAEDLVSECEEKIYNIKKDKITGDNIYNYLLMFEKVYADLSDSEKKAFYSALLEEIQLYEEDLPNGQMIKSIKFKFPVFYDGKFTDTIFRDKESTVETVCLLSKK